MLLFPVSNFSCLFYFSLRIYSWTNIFLLIAYLFRFHLLEEFDEGKRSCRRRLAGHNKRRRKTQPDAASTLGGAAALDEKTTSYIIISLLRILSSLHCMQIPPLFCFYLTNIPSFWSHLLLVFVTPDMLVL